jgi:BolA family transcriptional regulator, general stress-responsive regulator
MKYWSMTRIERIKKQLDALKPQYLEIIDQSLSHREHLENPDSSETHLVINIWSDVFQSKTKLQQHRVINDLISEEFNSGLHALSINIKEGI